MTESQVPS
jgi:hypothetical protein